MNAKRSGSGRKVVDVQTRRLALLKRYYDACRLTTWPYFQRCTADERRRAYDRAARNARAYRKLLAPVPICRSPFTDEPLAFACDRFGFDGPWWDRGWTDRLPKTVGAASCRLVLGAVDLRGRQLSDDETRGERYLGPEVPFVAPCIALPGTQAVLSRQVMPAGDILYLIAYFNQEVEQLWPPWFPRFQVSFSHHSTIRAGEWDFELQPWIDRGLLSWVAPDDGELRLVRAGPCPYVGLSGSREPQVFESTWGRLCAERGAREGLT